MAQRIPANVNHELIRWGRETAALDIESAARKLQIKPSRLQAWESGSELPTLGQLRRMAQTYKRPTAAFFLSTVPPTPDQPTDYRRLPTTSLTSRSAKLSLALRTAQYRREIAERLHGDSDSLPSFNLTIDEHDSPDVTGQRLRDYLNVGLDAQTSWRAGYECFNEWRRALEDSGVLVFQMTDVAVDEARGFSLFDEDLPAIVLNNKDSLNGRIFTMMHELTHLGLREQGLCLPQEAPLDTQSAQPPGDVEVLCNQIAGATLVPATDLEFQTTGQGTEAPTSDATLARLAARYGVSREVILRRLLSLGITDQAFYRTKRDQFLREYQQLGPRAPGFAPPHSKAISSVGRHYARLVLASYEQERITASDVAEYLGIRLKHLGKVEEQLARSAALEEAS